MGTVTRTTRRERSSMTGPADRSDRGLVTVNEPPSGLPFPDLSAVMRARECLYFLTWRDVKVRYKQTAIGAAWAILQPLTAMLIFTLVFSRLASVDSDGVPYPIFSYCALVPWTYFSTGLTQASGSLVLNERLVTRVYFPRLIIPLASVCGVLVDLGLATVVLVVLMFASSGSHQPLGCCAFRCSCSGRRWRRSASERCSPL